MFEMQFFDVTGIVLCAYTHLLQRHCVTFHRFLTLLPQSHLGRLALLNLYIYFSGDIIAHILSDALHAHFVIVNTRVSLTPSSCLQPQNQYVSNNIQHTMVFKHTHEEHDIKHQIKEQTIMMRAEERDVGVERAWRNRRMD